MIIADHNFERQPKLSQDGHQPHGIKQAQVAGWQRQEALRSTAAVASVLAAGVQIDIAERTSAMTGAAKGAIAETGKFLKGMGDGEVDFVRKL